MGLILRFLSGSLGPWIIIGSLSASGFAGWHVHKIVIKAESVSVLKREVEKLNSETEKANEAETTVDGLGDGAASDRLFREWSRKGQ